MRASADRSTKIVICEMNNNPHDEDNACYVVVSGYGYLGFDTELGLHTFGFPFGMCKKFVAMESAWNIAREIELESIDFTGSCTEIYVHRVGAGYIPAKFGF